MKRTYKIIIYSISTLGLLCAIAIIWFLFTWPPFSKENKFVAHVKNGNYVKVKETFNSGVDINKPGKWSGMMSGAWTDGRTPLTAAAEANQIRIAEYLLSKGADVNKYDGFGQTPVHVSAQHGRYEITKLFIKNKCNLNLMQLKHRLDPLTTAAIFGKDKEIVRLMLENGAMLDTTGHWSKRVVKFVDDTHSQSLIRLLKNANKQPNKDNLFNGQKTAIE